jgi:uncharacterized protein (DUF1697 family)
MVTRSSTALGMPGRYVALVRGVNVGGSGVIPMAELRALVEKCGVDDVSTYIASGNVLFSSGEPRAKVEKRLGATLAKRLGPKAHVFLRTREELVAAVDGNVLEPARHPERKCHLMFLAGAPRADGRAALAALEEDQYACHLGDRVLYYAYNFEIAGSRRFIDFERVLGVAGTSRTWKVVDKLIELLA